MQKSEVKNQKSKVVALGRRGQSTVEIIIALMILTVAMASAIMVIFGGQSLSVDSAESSIALRLAERDLESISAQARYDFNNLASSTTAQNEFTRNVIVQTVSANTKQVTARVVWSTDPLRTQAVELVTLVSNWQGVQQTGGDTGGSPPSGNWQNPRTLGTVDLGSGNQATDLDVKSKVVYMTATAASANKPDFFIINATDGQNPFVVSSINTGNGLNSVDVAGNYAYVAGVDDSKEFQVIDVSNVSAPSVVATLNLAGNADALTVFYFNGYAYIGLASGAAQEFQIINVSNPLSPSLVSGLSSAGGEINDIYVFNKRAYLGTEDGTRGMVVIDVASSTAPSVLGSMNAGGEHVYSVYVQQSESAVTVGGKEKLFMANASNSASITTLGSGTISDKVRDIVTVNPYAFLGTEDSNKEFQVWNVSNPVTPTLWSSFNFPQVATGVDYEDNIVYVSVRSNDALRIITSQ
ncbi:MAG: hypothetical protein HY433_03200 [Candidatus Liptonbacteria bacterium]|nr:hypothetical protein [Candidatus Liptonbacteria bacterium]